MERGRKGIWRIKDKDIYRLLGVKKRVFEKILKKVLRIWVKEMEKKRVSGRPFAIGDCRDHLILLLIFYRNKMTHLWLANMLGVDESTVSRAIRRIAPIVERAVRLPKIEQISLEKLKILIIDATEQRIQRPKVGQRKFYSGKKKCHTVKHEICVNERLEIMSVSDCYPGSIHDLKVRKLECRLPAGVPVLADRGYFGLDKFHDGLVLMQTKSNSKNGPGPVSNSVLARFRIGIEHVFARLKTFRILRDQIRFDERSYGQIFRTIAGIHNLNLSA